MGEFDVKCQPSGDDFYDFSRANFSVVDATEGHVRAGMQYDFTTKWIADFPFACDER